MNEGEKGGYKKKTHLKRDGDVNVGIGGGHRRHGLGFYSGARGGVGQV